MIGYRDAEHELVTRGKTGRTVIITPRTHVRRGVGEPAESATDGSARIDGQGQARPVHFSQRKPFEIQHISSQ